MTASTRQIRSASRARLVQLEAARVELQARLDAGKTAKQRNRLGQFATPTPLAEEIVAAALQLITHREQLRFLDPAFGTGAFYSALLRVSERALRCSRGFEIDPYYGGPARRLWSATPLELRLTDFTRANPPQVDLDRFNLVVCNPPYVRHHHLSHEQKQYLQRAARHAVDLELSGLSGLYCYFLMLSQAWMSRGGVAAWLVPSEFMDVNYGLTVKRFLLERVTLVRVHRFDAASVQFADALVSSAVVFFRNEAPSAGDRVEFTRGGTLTKPEQSDEVAVESLRAEGKCTRYPCSTKSRPIALTSATLGDLFTIKRGLATGCNAFFVVSHARAKELRIPRRFLTPILPSPRHLEVDEVASDSRGFPFIDPPQFLIDCRLSEQDVQLQSTALWKYFEQGRKLGVHQRYLCRHREPWYSQEIRPPAQLLCTYMGRSQSRNGAPFRFILNHSQATASNVYLLLYPKPWLSDGLSRSPESLRRLWQQLKQIGSNALTGEGRVYGGGLHKLEPRELANVSAAAIVKWIEEAQGLPSLDLH
jgi:adenine-specific DNA-methyltransferase